MKLYNLRDELSHVSETLTCIPSIQSYECETLREASASAFSLPVFTVSNIVHRDSYTSPGQVGNWNRGNSDI